MGQVKVHKPKRIGSSGVNKAWPKAVDRSAHHQEHQALITKILGALRSAIKSPLPRVHDRDSSRWSSTKARLSSSSTVMRRPTNKSGHDHMRLRHNWWLTPIIRNSGSANTRELRGHNRCQPLYVFFFSIKGTPFTNQGTHSKLLSCCYYCLK